MFELQPLASNSSPFCVCCMFMIVFIFDTNCTMLQKNGYQLVLSNLKSLYFPKNYISSLKANTRNNILKKKEKKDIKL